MATKLFTPSDYESLTQNTGMLHGSTNVGILKSQGKIYCIDAGTYDQDAEALHSTLETLFPGHELAAIINTHSHADHCGADRRLVELTGAQVWAPLYESRIMEFPSVMGALYWGGFPFAELQDEYFAPRKPIHVDRPLQAGQTIDFGDISLECIPLPGHFYDQLGLLVTDKTGGKTVFFLGDGFFGKEMLKKYWIPFMYNPEQFRSSVELIEGTTADWYVPSHGGVYDYSSISAIAEMNIIVTLETETLILKILRKVSMTHEEILEAVADFAGIDLKLSQFVLIGSTLRSYLSSLYSRGLVTFRIEDNRMLWSAV